MLGLLLSGKAKASHDRQSNSRHSHVVDRINKGHGLHTPSTRTLCRQDEDIHGEGPNTK